jgi:Thiol-disulfide isomerase and thioredoxins
MAEDNRGSGRTSAGPRWLVAAGVFALMIALVGAVYAYRTGMVDRADATLSSLATGSMAKLVVAPSPEPAPNDSFEGPDGTPLTLADFKGRVVVLNLWATWCAPCKAEMPTLAALAQQVDPDRVAVVVVNVDVVPENEALARAFIAEHVPLTFYRQQSFLLPFRLPGAGAMPQTVLIDRDGRVRASVTGAADWSSPEALAVIKTLVDEGP